MKIELSEKQLIYILNCMSISLKFMTYHYQITDIKKEITNFFNYDHYNDDYNNIITLHRILSLLGNSEFYGLKNEIFFKGQEDFLCSEEKDFNILQNSNRYKISENKYKIFNFVENKFKFKNKYSFFNKAIDKLKKVV